MPESKKDFFKRYVRAIAESDFASLETMIHPDYVGDYPQSGERFRGFAAFRAQLENYPGGLPAARFDDPNTKILGEEERWAISPGYTVLPLEAPERFTHRHARALSGRLTLVGGFDPDHEGRQGLARGNLLRARVRPTRVAQGHRRDHPARLGL